MTAIYAIKGNWVRVTRIGGEPRYEVLGKLESGDGAADAGSGAKVVYQADSFEEVARFCRSR